MCGIVGYVGSRRAAPILLDGLRKLEYRGYDSAGLAIHDGVDLTILRTVGKLIKLDEALERRPLQGSTGIGHTRWATHGRPSEANAHPHRAGPVAVVHNGIIENFSALRQELVAEGVELRSETDTEILAHLIHRELGRGAPSLFEAVRRALRQVVGTYAIAVVSGSEPAVLVVARDGSPLIVGVGQGEMLCGSDIPALLAHTRSMVFLEDGDVAELRPTGYRIEGVTRGPIERPLKHIDWSAAQAEKSGYQHFMLKEIHEQPEVVAATLRGRVEPAAGEVLADAMGLPPEAARAIRRVYLVACGTSFHAAMVGRDWIEGLARVPAVVELASEVRHRAPVFFADDLVVAISQSGETVDTLFAARAAREAGARVLAVCNVVDSAIPRLADGALYTHAGPEIGVASTKCFTAQLAALLLLAVYLGRRRDALPEPRARELLQALREVPVHMRGVLQGSAPLRALARRLVKAEYVLFLGRGLGYPIALEGALKLKEISYAHAEGYPAGELRNGPLALLEEGLPVVVVAPRDSHHDQMLATTREVRAHGGQIFAVATAGDEALGELGQPLVWLPEVKEEVLPFLTVLPLQLLAYHVADLKGNDVDQPRNLAKTVTVE